MSIWDALRNEAKSWSGAARNPAPTKGGRVNGERIPQGKQPVTKYKTGKPFAAIICPVEDIEQAFDELTEE